MNKQDVKTYLIEEADYSPESVERMSNYQMLDAVLMYEGICGYTQDIIDTIAALWNINLD